MKKTLFGLCVLLTIASVGCQTPGGKEVSSGTAIPLQDQTNLPNTIKLTSTDFKAGEGLALRHAFNGFGCVGKNIPPKLKWENAPKGTKSYALILHDPDAPTGVGFFHWVLINIPASATSLGAALPPNALQLHTDFGKNEYGGPCPPKGEKHRYVFRIYALNVPKLSLPPGATGALVRFMLKEHAIAMGQLVGTFTR